MELRLRKNLFFVMLMPKSSIVIVKFVLLRVILMKKCGGATPGTLPCRVPATISRRSQVMATLM
eukprot:7909945-Heterocapsa_arctica.AAC.1